MLADRVLHKLGVEAVGEHVGPHSLARLGVEAVGGCGGFGGVVDRDVTGSTGGFPMLRVTGSTGGESFTGSTGGFPMLQDIGEAVLNIGEVNDGLLNILRAGVLQGDGFGLAREHAQREHESFDWHVVTDLDLVFKRIFL